MAEIDETELPGIGIRREFTTSAGARLGVIETRTGRRDLLLYDRDDPDTCRSVVPLSAHDSDVLVDLLGGDRIVSDAAATLLSLEGLAIDWVRIDAASECAGRTIGECRIRSRTGASIAAVIDGDESTPGPGPEQVLPPGGLVVAVGRRAAVAALAELLGP